PRLTSRAQVMAPLAPWDEPGVRAAGRAPVDAARRAELFEGRLPEATTSATKRTLAAHVNAALTDEFARRPELIAFGEDVGRKGGVYGLTAGLQRRFGRARVFDTLLDETTILGVAQGAAHLGLLPVPEIQYRAYVHNAVDQLRGEACSLSFFSNGQYSNPMVVRIAGLAYQKGFGGHFHNDNSIGGLRDIPGLLLAVPARGDDAARLLRGAVAAARACGRVVVFLEPIALYHERDLYADGDGLWLSDYPAPGADDDLLLPGEVGVYGEANTDLLIVSYANGLRLSLRAARALEREHGLRARVLDLRWLMPLPFEAVERHARECGAVLVADECRATGGGVAEALIAHLAEARYAGRLASVRAADSYVPLGAAADLVLIDERQIAAAALELAR
ncbi:MAG TPA: transketolase C-terminal domain-containing protein, partial [Planctomycetota bacterium]|nr:transketolase C-terminal domain-containing protein [Planctomycetota bacterium]